MRTSGPEFQRGWRTRIEVDGVGIDIHATHHSRNRLPRGHEMAGQFARRGHFSLVEEIDHEWRVSPSRALPAAVCRRNPNGTFSINGRHQRETDLVEAVTAWAGSMLERTPAPGPRA